MTTAAVLVGAAGVAVGAGVLAVNTNDEAGATPEAAAAPTADVSSALRQHVEAAKDGGGISRSVTREPLKSVQRADKAAAMPATRQDVRGAITETVAPTDPRDIAMTMLADYGWSSSEFSCLDQLYLHESGWNPAAANPSSGAYGIPQALPGDKMASAGSDWQTNPATQLAWGLSYIQDRYGSPCGAWSFWESNNFY
jgi:hypothetical protein